MPKTRAKGEPKSDGVLSVRALNRATLARQMLLAREKASAVDAIARLAGMQAQVARPPFLGLWTRLLGFSRDELKSALTKKKVVRVTAMRATLHLLTTERFLALRASLQPMLDKNMGSILRERMKAVPLPAVLEEAARFFERTPHSMDALRDHLAAKFPKGDVRAMAYATRCTLPLVQLPNEDDAWSFPATAPFTTAKQWLGKDASRGDPSPDALVLGYLAAFGPASVADAQTWSAAPNLKEAFARLGPELVTFRDERGRELFDLPNAPRPHEDTPAPVRFLPDFDNLVLGHDDRTRVVPLEHKKRIVTKNLLVPGTFTVDGFVAGQWKTERKKKRATLTISPFSAVSARAKKELADEGERLLRFAEPDAEDLDVVFA